MTIDELRDELGLSRQSVGDRIRKRIAAGKISRRECIIGGCRVFVYRAVEGSK